MRKMRSLRLLCILLVVFSLVAGCAKKEAAGRTTGGAESSGQTPTGNAGGPNTSGGASGKPAGGAGTIRLSPVGRKGAPPVSNRLPATEGKTAMPSGTDELLTLRGGRSVYPSDFDIGSLQPGMPAGTTQGAILECIDQFFAELSQGKVDKALLSPTWRDNLVRLLSYPVSNGELPSAVRIGRLTVGQDKAHAAIRMERGKGRSDGEIYLERVDSKWFISDIQTDFRKLMVPFERAQTFDPAEWKSLMKE